ncbi:hypothetical protein R1flu_011795 [Riccia fluitans]|uniref:Alkyl transferase n=1 Tax=Riccia fluitans TaxID=41844 RepID=A0ABD1Z9Y3_9MARC
MEEANSTKFSSFSYFISWYSEVCGYFRRLILRILAVGPVPKHIAIIMDGNRRYADRSHMDRTRGHLYGYDRLISTLEICSELGVKYVTVYAFSIDNFRRPADEVQALMNLMEEKLDHICNSYRLTKEFGVRVQVLGELSLLPGNVRAAAERAMVATRQNTSVVLNICLAYTSTVEMVHSIQEIRDKFLSRLPDTFPSYTESKRSCSCECEADHCSSLMKPIPGVRSRERNGYNYGSEGIRRRSCQNDFLGDGVAKVNLKEVDSKSGQELRNGWMTVDGEAGDRLAVSEVAEESAENHFQSSVLNCGRSLLLMKTAFNACF